MTIHRRMNKQSVTVENVLWFAHGSHGGPDAECPPESYEATDAAAAVEWKKRERTFNKVKRSGHPLAPMFSIRPHFDMVQYTDATSLILKAIFRDGVADLDEVYKKAASELGIDRRYFEDVLLDLCQTDVFGPWPDFNEPEPGSVAV